MRKLLFTTLLVAVSLSAAAQSQDSITAKAQATNQQSIPPVLAPENMPEFPGGKAEMMKFISKNIKYPKLAEKYLTIARLNTSSQHASPKSPKPCRRSWKRSSLYNLPRKLRASFAKCQIGHQALSMASLSK